MMTLEWRINRGPHRSWLEVRRGSESPWTPANEEVAAGIVSTLSAQVIEECAAVAERLFLDATDTEWDEGVNTAKREIAKSIRALKGET